MAEPEDLSRRLESLEADLGDADLPGPSAARRRARLRARRRNAAVGLVVAVAAGALAFPASQLLRPDPELPPVQPAPTTTPSPTPSPETAEPLTDEVLLSPDDMEPDDADPLGWDITWDTDSPGDPPFEPFACAPEPSADAAEVLERSLAVLEDRDPWEGRVDHLVERFDGPAAAQAQFDEIREAVFECARDLDAGPSPPDQWSWDGIGDHAWLARYWTPADAPEGQGELVEFSLVWTGNAVTSVTRGFHTMDANLPMEPDLATTATERLCGPADGRCVDDPQPLEADSTEPGDDGTASEGS